MSAHCCPPPGGAGCHRRISRFQLTNNAPLTAAAGSRIQRVVEDSLGSAAGLAARPVDVQHNNVGAAANTKERL